MTGKISIDCSVPNLRKIWDNFRKGKRKSRAIDYFTYYLEKELEKLSLDLTSKTYKHGNYYSFMVFDNKKRKIEIAAIRDRIVHRLIYEYLVEIFDKSFIYDAWSCRKNKGLIKAIERCQYFANRYCKYFFWKADVVKFFQSIDQDNLIKYIELKVKERDIIDLIKEVVYCYKGAQKGKGMPIGNLTSQIFANIYMNELDFFMQHKIKHLGYMRYGDDFLVFGKNRQELEMVCQKVTGFVTNTLKLTLHGKKEEIFRVKSGIKFLGVQIFPGQRFISKRNKKRIFKRMDLTNNASYFGMIKHHQPKLKMNFAWKLLEDLPYD